MAYHLFVLSSGKTSYRTEQVLNEQEFERVMDLNAWKMPYGMRVFHAGKLEGICNNPVLKKFPKTDISVSDLFASSVHSSIKLKDKMKKNTQPVLKKSGNGVIVESEDGYGRFYRLDGKNTVLMAEMEVTPIHLKEATEYVKRYHRHCGPPKFHKFSISLRIPEEAEPIGVVIASTPKAKALMDGKTLEINRVCTNPCYANVCSKLYAQAIRAGKALGYQKFITYTLEGESGSSLKAVGFQFAGITSGKKHGWNSPSRCRKQTENAEMNKQRWMLLTC